MNCKNESAIPQMNSREKGKRGERQWRDELRANGFHARRGQQFAGSPDSPDVVCEELDWIHFEVKAIERLNIEDAMDQARRDGGASRTGHQKTPVVAHRRSHRRWLVTMDAEFFFRLLRGEIPETEATPDRNTSSGLRPPSDSRAPARSALDGPLPSANSFRSLPKGSSPQSGEGGAHGGPSRTGDPRPT
jgi:Holliday junction resolvase